MGRDKPGGRRHLKDPRSEYQWPTQGLKGFYEHAGIFTSVHMTEAAPGLDTLSYVSLSRWSVSSTNTALLPNVLFPFHSLLFEKCLPEATDNFCPFLILNIATSTTEWLLCVRHSSKDLHYWIIWSSLQSCKAGTIIFSVSQVRQLRNRAAAAPEGSRTRMRTQAAGVQRPHSQSFYSLNSLQWEKNWAPK